MKKMLCAGLDISTTVCGYSIINEDKELVDKGYYKFKKQDDWELIHLAEQFSENVLPKLENVDFIILEDALKKYSSGFSSNKSITVLLQFNAIIRYILQKKFGIDKIKTVHVNTARKSSLGRAFSPKGIDAKQWVLEQISSKFSIEWPLTRFGNIQAECEDIADSIILSLYGANTYAKQ